MVPETIFEELGNIAELLNNEMIALPTNNRKLSREEYVSLAQFETKTPLSPHIRRIALFSEGVLAMKQTLVGLVALDPNELLERGLRSELRAFISDNLKRCLAWTDAQLSTVSPTLFHERMEDLLKKLSATGRALELVQDFLQLHALRIWHDEMSALVADS